MIKIMKEDKGLAFGELRARRSVAWRVGKCELLSIMGCHVYLKSLIGAKLLVGLLCGIDVYPCCAWIRSPGW